MGIDAIMLVKLKQEYTDREVLKFAFRLSEAFWRDPFRIVRPNHRLAYMGVQHAISRIKSDQCFIDPESENPDMFLRVNLITRHYSAGYERGNLPLIMAVASWLDANINGEVWYCGDCDEYAQPFTLFQRELLWKHFCAVGHVPYTATSRAERPSCDFCLEQMIARSFAGPITGYECDGCGHKIEVHNANPS